MPDMSVNLTPLPRSNGLFGRLLLDILPTNLIIAYLILYKNAESRRDMPNARHKCQPDSPSQIQWSVWTASS